MESRVSKRASSKSLSPQSAGIGVISMHSDNRDVHGATHDCCGQQRRINATG
jgi:hypothetical protein